METDKVAVVLPEPVLMPDIELRALDLLPNTQPSQTKRSSQKRAAPPLSLYTISPQEIDPSLPALIPELVHMLVAIL